MSPPKDAVKLRVVPCTNERAKEYVEAFHRHHGASVQARFAVAAVDPTGAVRGVVMVGRPVARLLDDGWTLEMNRLATDGCPNACSLLYGAARRIAKELGYAKLITYIREDEPGSSLRGSGWQYEGPIRARSWDMPRRPRIDKTEIVPRGRWSVQLGERVNVEWPRLESEQAPLDFGEVSRA